jgi:hypothetical protein
MLLFSTGRHVGVVCAVESHVNGHGGGGGAVLERRNSSLLELHQDDDVRENCGEEREDRRLLQAKVFFRLKRAGRAQPLSHGVQTHLQEDEVHHEVGFFRGVALHLRFGCEVWMCSKRSAAMTCSFDV